MIAIIQGGESSEAAVSRVTSQAMQNALSELGEKFEVFEADKDLYSHLTSKKFKCALIALHGHRGEDGIIQSLCEYIHLPYTGSGVLASALCFNKEKTKDGFRLLNIPTPDGFLIEKCLGTKVDDYKKPKHFPVVIKPNKDGSSVGVYICQNKEEYLKSLEEALQKFTSLVVEQFIEGSDTTVGVFNGEALEPILIRPKSGFYNYENKYTAGKTEYIIPAPLKPETIKKMKEYSTLAYKYFDIRTYARVDFMCTPDERLFALEVNTLPGCTPTSLLPKAAAYAGFSFKEIVKSLIENASLDY